MKKILLFVVSTFMFACTQAPQPYTVNGKLAGKHEDKIIYLSSASTGEKIDSTVIKDGKFMFEGVLAKSDIGRLAIKGGYPVELVLEPGNIYIEFGKAMYADSLSGTPLNAAMFACYSGDWDIVLEYSDVFREIEAKYKGDQAKIDSEINKVMEEVYSPRITKLFNNAFEKNRDNILGANLFGNYNVSDSKSSEEIKAYMAENPFAANYKPLQDFLEQKEFQEATAVGQMFTDFTGRNMDDTKDVKLSDYAGKGKYVLIDFWATWCGPCIRVMPKLAELHKKYADKGFVLLSINVADSRENAVKKIEELDMTWAQMFMPKGAKSIELYGERGIPTIILIAPDGKIELKKASEKELIEHIENLFVD